MGEGREGAFALLQLLLEGEASEGSGLHIHALTQCSHHPSENLSASLSTSGEAQVSLLDSKLMV